MLVAKSTIQETVTAMLSEGTAWESSEYSVSAMADDLLGIVLVQLDEEVEEYESGDEEVDEASEGESIDFGFMSFAKIVLDGDNDIEAVCSDDEGDLLGSAFQREEVEDDRKMLKEKDTKAMAYARSFIKARTDADGIVTIRKWW